MNLTKDQIELLCALIDGYVYPRFLCQVDPTVDTEGVWDRSKEFLEIRQVLEPDPDFDIEDEDTYPPFFQHSYWEHDYFYQLDTNKKRVFKKDLKQSDNMTVHEFGYQIFNMFQHNWPDEDDFSNDYYKCNFKLLLSKITEIQKRADTLKELVWILRGTNVLNIIKEVK